MSFKVLETSEMNDHSPNLHIFRSEQHFINWMKETSFGEDEFNEFLEGWNTDGAVAHGKESVWEPYAGLYEIDHTAK